MFQFKKTTTALSLIAVALIAFTIACQKDAAQTAALTDEQKVTAAKKTLQASLFFTNSFTQATFASGKANGFAGDRDGVVLRGACADPTVLPNDFFTFPKTVTINYGTGCTDDFGRNKSGKMTLNVGKFWEAGSVIKATFENFMEDSTKLNGAYTFTNNSTATTIDHSFSAENIVFTDKMGRTSTYTIRQRHLQVAGMTTRTERDDVYNITTSLTSREADGTTTSWENTTPLKKANNCRWIQKGTGTIKVNNETSIIDFGNDTCDDDATLTTNGVVRNIKL
jgi:hypothetical protein